MKLNSKGTHHPTFKNYRKIEALHLYFFNITISECFCLFCTLIFNNIDISIDLGIAYIGKMLFIGRFKLPALQNLDSLKIKISSFDRYSRQYVLF